VEDSLLYAEPVYIQADGVNFPELKKVILASANKVVMEDSLDEALAALTGDKKLLGRSGPDFQAPASGEPNAASAPASMQGSIDALEDALESLRDNLADIEEALKGLTDSFGNQ
jgi:uncharacterized membrane protein (UPF0182 family)